jgi:hypothetical protein
MKSIESMRQYLWFKKASACNIPIFGPIIQSAAQKFAEKFEIKDFIALNGWLESFRKRHQIVLGLLSGEGKSADFSTADQFKEKNS